MKETGLWIGGGGREGDIVKTPLISAICCSARLRDNQAERQAQPWWRFWRVRDSGMWNGEVGSGGETAKTTTTERTDGWTTIQDRPLNGSPAEGPSRTVGSVQTISGPEEFPLFLSLERLPGQISPTNARSGCSPIRSLGLATLSAALACFPNWRMTID